jgi:Zn-dependent protease
MDILNSIIYVVILIFSVALHEIAHGYAALHEGDDTALRAGRLTLNPISHLDMFGSVILPILLVISQTGFVFGWAKPVPYDERRLRNHRKSILLVASAGIIANLLIAIIFALLIRASGAFGIGMEFLPVFSIIVLLNIVLAIFNLVPIPPLDGSKILFALLPERYQYLEATLLRYSFIFVIIFIFFLWQYISPIVTLIFRFLVGT